MRDVRLTMCRCLFFAGSTCPEPPADCQPRRLASSRRRIAKRGRQAAHARAVQEWQIAVDEGYCSKQSALPGSFLDIMVGHVTPLANSTRIFTGYYGGRGARLMKGPADPGGAQPVPPWAR